MNPPRHYTSRVDHNQAEIVEALRRIGLTVEITTEQGKGFPDLLVGDPMAITIFNIEDQAEVALLILSNYPSAIICAGGNLPVEIKNPRTRGKLNGLQRRWHAQWSGPRAVVRSVEEAIHLFRKKCEIF